MDIKCSRQHCAIECQDGQVILVDLGATNGTKLNEKKMGKNSRVPLRHGDAFRLGLSVFVLHWPQQAAPAKPAGPAPKAAPAPQVAADPSNSARSSSTTSSRRPMRGTSTLDKGSDAGFELDFGGGGAPAAAAPPAPAAPQAPPKPVAQPTAKPTRANTGKDPALRTFVFGDDEFSVPDEAPAPPPPKTPAIGRGASYLCFRRGRVFCSRRSASGCASAKAKGAFGSAWEGPGA
jgi:predicted component of type VI protein secretion system